MVLLALTLVIERSLYVNTITRLKTSFPLNLKWRVDLGSSTYERPAYENGLVFLPASNNGKRYWYGIDANTSSVVWSQELEQYNFLRCLTPGYMVLSGPRSLIVLQTPTGEIVWQESRPPAYTATCSKEMVFSSGVPRDSIWAYDLTTGKRLWMGTEPWMGFHGLIYNPESAEIISRHGQKFYVIEAQTGVLKSSFVKITDAPDDLNTERGPMYVIDRGELFVGGTVQDAQTGRIIHQEDQFKTFRPPTVTTDTMYLSAYFGGIEAFDRADYSLKWVYQPQPSDPLNPLAPIVILNGTGYAIFSDATLRAFDLETGQELGYWQPEASDLWWWPVCSFPPLLCDESARAGLAPSDDKLFVSFGDGKLYAFGQ